MQNVEDVGALAITGCAHRRCIDVGSSRRHQMVRLNARSADCRHVTTDAGGANHEVTEDRGTLLVLLTVMVPVTPTFTIYQRRCRQVPLRHIKWPSALGRTRRACIARCTWPNAPSVTRAPCASSLSSPRSPSLAASSGISSLRLTPADGPGAFGARAFRLDRYLNHRL